ncbi:hypothetical protein SDC9_152274 [bioreactor metagenome]|uniref:Glycosyltransferase 2-like domain-containing protein n=1 Tax=bioreactor metagenome TaxID=1076179 RepID=A0A645ESP1_9ZZZZ
MDSVINQTYRDLEIILVDDGSPDNCGAICDEYATLDKRIKVIHKENGGVSDARNAGINASSGFFISFIDSDDYVSDNYILNLYKGISDNDCDMCISGCRYIDENLNFINARISKKNIYNTEDFIDKFDDTSLFGYSCSKMYVSSIIKNHNIEFNIKMTLREDMDFNIKYLSNVKKISVINDTSYNYLQRKSSALNNTDCSNIEKKIKSCELLCETIRNKNNVISKKAASDIITCFLFDISCEIIKTTNLNIAIKYEMLSRIYKNEVYKNLVIYSVDKPLFIIIYIITLKIKCYKLFYCLYHVYIKHNV